MVGETLVIAIAAQPGADAARAEVQAARTAQDAREARIVEEAARARADAAAAEQEAARAAQEAVRAAQQGQVSVDHRPDGRVRITTGDGRTIDIDPNQIAHDALAGLTHAAPPPVFGERPDRIRDGIIPLVGIIFGMITATIIGLPIARAFARRMDRRTDAAPQGQGPDVTVRLERIEQAIETIAVEVERVSEGQRFATKLLTERANLVEPTRAAAEGYHVR